jgi:hypothetical protein
MFYKNYLIYLKDIKLKILLRKAGFKLKKKEFNNICGNCRTACSVVGVVTVPKLYNYAKRGNKGRQFSMEENHAVTCTMHNQNAANKK